MSGKVMTAVPRFNRDPPVEADSDAEAQCDLGNYFARFLVR